MYIAFVFSEGRLDMLRSAQKNCIATDFFYGAIELERFGHAVEYLEVNHEIETNIFGGIVNIMQTSGWLPEKLTGGLIQEIFKIKDSINKCDCVVATSSGIGFAISLLKKLGYLKVPIVTIHCALANHPYGWFRQWCTQSLLKMQGIVLFGDAEKNFLLQNFKGIEELVSVNQFGIDTHFWVPGETKGKAHVLSVGNDGRRDYQTLCNAARNISMKVKLLTRLKIEGELPDNVELLCGSWKNQFLTDEELRTLYQTALCVVIPLVESLQPSGQSVCLQAMACGIPVVLTQTSGLWSQEYMQDGKNVLLVDEGDVNGIIEAIRLLSDNPCKWDELSNAGLQMVRNDLNIVNFARRIALACEHSCQKPF